MIYLHVGLAKTYTTSLQLHAFNKITKCLNIDYFYFGQKNNDLYDLNNFFNENKNINSKKFDNFPINKIKKDILISNENLSTVDNLHTTKNIYESIKILEKYFNNKTKIILTIRNPIKYINSIYNECYKEGNIIKKKDFIENYFQLQYFSYSKIIENYRLHYDEVVVFKVDSENFIENLLNHFNIKNINKEKLLTKVEKKSLSNLSINVCIRFDNLLKYFGSNFKEYINYVRNKSYKQKKAFWNFMDITYILRKIDNIFDLKKTDLINTEDYDFSKLNKEYEALKDFQLFKK